MLNKKKITGAVLSLGILASGGMVSIPTALAAPGQDTSQSKNSVGTLAAKGEEGSEIKALWNGDEPNTAYYMDKEDNKYKVKDGWNVLRDGNEYYVCNGK